MRRWVYVLIFALALAGAGNVLADEGPDAATDDKDAPAAQDFVPNPHEQAYETAKAEAKSAYGDLEELIGTFRFDDLVAAYARYAKARAALVKVQEEYEAFEEKHRYKLVLRVYSADLAQLADGPQIAMHSDNAVLTSDPAPKLSSLAKPIAASVTLYLGSNTMNNDPDACKVFKTDANGVLRVQRLPACPTMVARVEAPEHRTATAVIEDRAGAYVTEKEIYIEAHSAWLAGTVRALPPVENGAAQTAIDVKSLEPIPAILTFRHSTGRTWSFMTMEGVDSSRDPLLQQIVSKIGETRIIYVAYRMLPGEYTVTVEAREKKSYRPVTGKVTLERAAMPSFQDFVLTPVIEDPVPGEETDEMAEAPRTGESADEYGTSSSLDDPLGNH